MIIKFLKLLLINFGLDLRVTYNTIKGLPLFIKSSLNLLSFIVRNDSSDFKLKLFPILSDAKSNSGITKGHYFHQDLWAARKIFKNKPSSHIDVGSRIDGFIAHLLSFMNVTVIDVRPLISKVDGLSFIQRDMMTNVGAHGLSSDSVSCLHALEHFGLSRYGDPFDWSGWKKGLRNLSSLVNDGGRLYLSVPIGIQTVEFNAHRIFDPKMFVNEVEKLGLSLHEFSYIDDYGDFHEGVDVNDWIYTKYGCGCFEFIKPETNNYE